MQLFSQSLTALHLSLWGRGRREAPGEGALSTLHAVFIDAAVQATTYEIAIFALVVVLVPFLKPRPHDQQGAPSGRPVMVEV